MSRVFFISSNTATDPYPVYPLGMAVVSAALRQAGHQVRQYDCLVHGAEPDRVAAAAAAFAPDLVAITLRNIDNVDSFSGDDGWYLNQAKELVVALRGRIGVPIVVGGPALTILPQEIATYLGVDHAVIGEGEEALPRLVSDLEAGKELPQLIARREPLGGDLFSAPLFEQELIDFYHEQSGMVNLQTKRGCPHSCSYCTYPHLEGTRFRSRQAGLVVDELERMQRDNGVERVFFTDSVFNDPRGAYLELIEEILRRDLKLQWAAFFRPQDLGRPELALMKRAGLYALELGTDAAADRTLAGLNKKLSFDEILDVNRACLDEHLPAAHYVMFGGPDEDRSTLEEGLNNMAELGESVVFAFSGIRIHPGAELHRRAIAEGVIGAETPLLKPIYYFSPAIDRAWMEDEIKRSFNGRKNRVFPPSEGLKRIMVMRDFGYRGLMWDRLIRFPGAAAKRAG